MFTEETPTKRYKQKHMKHIVESRNNNKNEIYRGKFNEIA